MSQKQINEAAAKMKMTELHILLLEQQRAELLAVAVASTPAEFTTALSSARRYYKQKWLCYG